MRRIVVGLVAAGLVALPARVAAQPTSSGDTIIPAAPTSSGATIVPAGPADPQPIVASVAPAPRRRPRLSLGTGVGLAGLGENPFRRVLTTGPAEAPARLGGFLSVGLARTRSGRGGTPGTRFTAGRPDRGFLTVPQASLSYDVELGDVAQLHLQLDLATDIANPLPDGLSFNEAYVLFDRLPHGLALRLGGYSPPLASWEVNGRFLTLDDTITHSVVNTPFEAGRVAGLELTNALRARPGALRVSLGLFGQGDSAASGGHAPAFGAMDDGLGLGGLTRGAALDDEAGFFVDLEAPGRGPRPLGARLSYQDAGGDATGPAPTLDQRVLQVGVRTLQGPWKLQSQLAWVDTRSGTGPADRTDSRAWYLLLNRRLGARSSASLRHGRYRNQSPAAFDDGHAWTVAFNRHLSRQSMFQCEWLRLTQGVDADDDLIQARFMVWF